MSRNAENGLLIFVCNIYEIFVMQKCYVIFILQLELFDGLHFVVIDSVTGNLMQDAVSIS